MDHSQLDYALRSRQHQLGYTVSNEMVVLVPHAGSEGLRVAAAYAATVTTNWQERCTVVLGYTTVRRLDVARRQTDADHFFLQLGNPLLEGALERERAAHQCHVATKHMMQPLYPTQTRFETLKQELARITNVVQQLGQKLDQEGDLLAAREQLVELETVMGVMRLRATNLANTREMQESLAHKGAAELLSEAMMRNYARYPAATIEKFMPTPSAPLAEHSCVRHVLWTVNTDKLLVELKRRYREANNYLSGVAQCP